MKEVGNNPLRRPHLKSRTGCTQCKQRRTKCDERKPVCQRCIDTGKTCSFLLYHPLARGPSIITLKTVSSFTSHTSTPPSHSSPPLELSPRLSQPPSHFSALDLEIFHYFTTTVAGAIVDYQASIEIFQVTAMKLAFEHPFLLHEVLSVAALQLSDTNQHNPAKSKDYAEASSKHLAAALSLVLPEILNIGSHNCDACFIFGAIIFYHAWAAQDPSHPSTLFFASDEPLVDGEPVLHTAPWIKLHFATRKNLDPIWPLLRKGSLLPLFQALGSLDPNRDDPLDPIEKEVLDDLATAWHNPTSALSLEQMKTLDKTMSQLIRVNSMINPKFNYNTGKVTVVMGWLSWVPDDFLKMLEMKLSEALLIGLYYCVCLNQLQHIWALKQKGKNLMETRLVVLEKRDGTKWERWTKWPVQQVLDCPDNDKTVCQL